ncbi:hypothetical protein [Novipirellula aureliae]|uniref:hypothetical protein n=1 Tax=Novipirellula aureliae TaxID=2527966 RepID=UPI0011B6CE62|nr:hypothetical protein [Novipirellula aureliae]
MTNCPIEKQKTLAAVIPVFHIRIAATVPQCRSAPRADCVHRLAQTHCQSQAADVFRSESRAKQSVNRRERTQVAAIKDAGSLVGRLNLQAI